MAGPTLKMRTTSAVLLVVLIFVLSPDGTPEVRQSDHTKKAPEESSMLPSGVATACFLVNLLNAIANLKYTEFCSTKADTRFLFCSADSR